MSRFDPYHRWLGIPPEEQPAAPHRLLGLSETERDVEVIRAAAERHSMHVRSEAGDAHADARQRILAEIATACEVLTDPAKRAAYDLGSRRASSEVKKRSGRPKSKKGTHASTALPFLDFGEGASSGSRSDDDAPEWLQSKSKSKSKRDVAADSEVEFGNALSTSTPSSIAHSKGASDTPAPFIALAICMVLGVVGYFVFANAPVIKAKDRKPILASDLQSVDVPPTPESIPTNTDNSTPAIPFAAKPTAFAAKPTAFAAKPTVPPPSKPESPTAVETPSADQDSPDIDRGKEVAEPREPTRPADHSGKSDALSPDSAEFDSAASDTTTPKTESTDTSVDERSPIAVGDPPSTQSTPAEKKTGGEGDASTEKQKDFVRYKGQDLRITDFRNRCAYVDETNFTTISPEEAVFVEVRLGRKVGENQLMLLQRHGKDTKLTCEFNWRSFPRSLKENQVIWAYGWFTDPPTGEGVFERDRGDGREGGPAPETTYRRRSFHMIATNRVDTRSANKRLKATGEILGKGGNVAGGQLMEIQVGLVNPTNVSYVDVEVEVVVSFGAARILGEQPNRRIVDFERVPAKTLGPLVKTIQMRNELPAEFVPKVSALVVHAIEVKE